MDEPTAALSGVEVERLFAVARSLRDEGRALVFISHRFDEVFALCDTVTVMRDGEYISTDPIAETTVDRDRRQMVGREVGDLFPKTPAEIGDAVLEVSGPRRRAGVFHDISFTVRAGEIVAPGRPRRRRPQRDRPGDLRRRPLRRRHGRRSTGKPCRPAQPARRDPRRAWRFVPEDRRKQGLVTDASVARNVAAVIRARPRPLRAAHHGSPRTRRPDRGPSRLEVKTSALDMRRRDDERRQPAEGRPRQVAGHRTRRC